MGKPVNSRRKGKQGELEAAKLLRRFGFQAKRSQQHSGKLDVFQESAPDILSNFPTHIEVKRTEDILCPDWVRQCRTDCPDEPWLVMSRQSRSNWWIMAPADTVSHLGLIESYESLTEVGGSRWPIKRIRSLAAPQTDDRFFWYRPQFRRGSAFLIVLAEDFLLASKKKLFAKESDGDIVGS